MPEREALIGSYVHLDKEQRAKDALHTLQRIASLVKPIMRARGWKVGRLAEFYPDDPSLYGLNMNKGSKICLRLRYPGDRNQFMPFEEVTDTMLHELCHIVHGPHNERFHALWDQLRDELKGLMMKGYTGEGFLSQGRRLGGRRIPRQEAQRLARETAEKSRRQRLPLPKQGRRLGGAPVHPGQDMRSVIASAVERRNKVLQGCASERLNDSQIRDIADTATKTGFRTQAEEEEANEAAISQALWELVQEDEKQRLGDAYVPPSASLAGADEAGSAKPRELQSPASITRAGASRNVSDSGDSSGAAGKQSRSNEPTNWVCETCTLHNPLQYLCCDACGAERVLGKRQRAASNRESQPSREIRTTIDLTGSPPRKRGTMTQRGEAPQEARRSTWTCKQCTMEMDSQWWTCATCGWMKDSS